MVSAPEGTSDRPCSNCFPGPGGKKQKNVERRKGDKVLRIPPSTHEKEALLSEKETQEKIDQFIIKTRGGPVKVKNKKHVKAIYKTERSCLRMLGRVRVRCGKETGRYRTVYDERGRVNVNKTLAQLDAQKGEKKRREGGGLPDRSERQLILLNMRRKEEKNT